MASGYWYQTLDDNGNYDEVRQHGPYECCRNDAWLGDGYYFWDTFIENAHWWGEKGYKGKYIVCRAKYNLENDSCFDLVGNTSDLEDFRTICGKMKECGSFGDDIIVADVIALLRKTPNFNYKAVRAPSTNAKNDNGEYSIRYKKGCNNRQRLDLIPLIQICLFNNEMSYLKEFDIVYPEML